MTTEPLPPYSGDEPDCPKCSHSHAYTEYRAHGSCVHSAEGTVGLEPNERLHRQCARCGYAWDEATVEPAVGCGPECSEMHTETGRCEIATQRNTTTDLATTKGN